LRVIVIGAGVAGLTAANELQRHSHQVVVFDKARRVGGRLSTVSVGEGSLADAGAQFFTVRTDEFGGLVAQWEARGVVHEWCRGFETDDGHPRYAALGGMKELASHMATGLDVRCSHRVTGVDVGDPEVSVRWPEAHGHAGGRLAGDAMIVTTPVPQAMELLGSVGSVPPFDYEPTFSLMVALDQKVRISRSGGRQITSDPVLSFIGDNQAKGTSTRPCVTFHSSATFATDYFDAPPEDVERLLLSAAGSYLDGATVIESKLHRWRYATPIDPYPDRFLDVTAGSGRVLLSGDAFGGPRVEGAFLSGLSAARRLVDSRPGSVES
jgi:predicted NAD/FAD-dependent oxidoreductase